MYDQLERLEALSQRDEKGFLAALQFASQNWAKWVSKYAKEESVCFVDGVGLVRLAYRVLGHPFAVVDENIRQGLLA